MIFNILSDNKVYSKKWTYNHARGYAGILQTVRLISALIQKYKTDKYIRKLSIKIARGYAGKYSKIKAARRIFRYIKNHIKYVDDVRGMETVQTPKQTLFVGAGDCDDFSALAGAMLESVGIKTVLIIAGNMGFSHIYNGVVISNKIISFDTTQKNKIGQYSPYRTKKVFKVGV